MIFYNFLDHQSLNCHWPAAVVTSFYIKSKLNIKINRGLKYRIFPVFLGSIVHSFASGNLCIL